MLLLGGLFLILILGARLVVRWRRPKGLTWVLHPFVSHGANIDHYLTPRDYWALLWTHGYWEIGDPDPCPCCNIPWIWLELLLYACFTAVLGRPRLRYAHRHEHIQWTAPWPNDRNDPAYIVTHCTYTYSPYFD